MSGLGVSLADYLWGDKKDGFSGFYGRPSAGAYSLTAGSALPTQTDVNAADKPEDKLKLLRQMADVVNVQADAALATGRADALGSMAKSAKDMLASLESVVGGLKSGETEADGQADTGAAGYKSGVAAALGSLRTAMDKIATLTSRAPSATAAAISAELSAMDDRAGAVAATAGTTWQRSGTAFRADPSKLVDILV